MNREKPVVVIRCVTYNHVDYIQQCLEGFVMQQTTFPFVAIVHDDASTDGTAKIVCEYAEKYPDIIHPIYETENQYSKNDGSLGRIMDAAVNATGAKYIAMCEGDDYWTDPLKLQKQVDYLETHDECVMCVHAAEWDCNGEKNLWGCQYDHECNLTTDEVIRNGGLYINLCSTIYRKSAIPYGDNRPRWWKMADVGDYPLHIAGTLYGTCHFFPKLMSVYRYQHEGAWTSQKNYQFAIRHTQCEINWLEELDKETSYKYTNAIHYHLWRYYSALYKQKKVTLKMYLQSIKQSDMKKNVMYKRVCKDIILRCIHKVH